MPQPRRVVKGVTAGFNATGSNLAAKRILRRDPGNGVQAVQLATAANQSLLGVSMAQIFDDDTGDVQVDAGVAVVDSGAAVSIGDRITADAQGRGVAAAADNNFVIGEARTATSGADEEFEMRLYSPGTQRGA